MPPDEPPAPRPPIVAASLTVGFIAAVAMWVVGYLTHFPGFQAPKAVVAALMALCQVGGGVLAARWAPRGGWLIAALGGFIASLINLLIVGSLVGEDGVLRDGWAVMVGGTLAFGPIVGVLGCAAGQLLPRDRPPAAAGRSARETWLARFGRLTPIAALPVLFSGGLVTTFDAGLAVHDWPGTYDDLMFLFPLQDMTGGIYYEHAHRLFGALAGLTVLVLMLLSLAMERRTWVKTAVVIAFAAVCLQGVLGGVGVTEATDLPDAIAQAGDGAEVPGDFAAAEDTEHSKLLRAIHGATGQLTFAYLCITASFLSLSWRRAGAGPAATDRLLRVFATAAAHTLVLQLVVGVIVRHYENPPGSLHLHITLAVLLAVIVPLAGFRAASNEANPPILRALGIAMVAGVGLQIALGFGAMFMVMPTYEDPASVSRASLITATLHHMNGVGLLACAWLLDTWARRLVAKGGPGQSAGPDAPAPPAGPAPVS